MQHVNALASQTSLIGVRSKTFSLVEAMSVRYSVAMVQASSHVCF